MTSGRFSSLTRTTLRWGWFAGLVAVALGFLTAGRSTLRRPTATDVDQLIPEDQRPSEVRRASRLRSVEEGLRDGIDTVDEVWSRALAERGLRSAEPADWLTVCRRLSLALVGSGVSLEEIRRLERMPQADRESAHLAALLQDPRFHDYWGERWTRLLVGTDDGPFLVYRRRRFRVWLSEQFAANERYDRLVRRLITAEGLWTDRPEVNFWTATLDSGDGQPDPERLAARASRVFLGLRIDCLQCHDDFLGNVSLGDVNSPRPGEQTDFHQLAAFFSAAQARGLQGIRGRPADYRYQYLDGDEAVSVTPAVPYQPELLPAAGGDRGRFAAWVTHPENRQAARAAVSHVWALMFGRPIGDSVDDLPLGMRGPDVLEALTDEFIQARYDLQRLIRLITGSAPFRVGSIADFEITPGHEAAMAVFPLVRLRPEQVAGSIFQASRIKRADRGSAFVLQLQRLGMTNDFVRRFGDLGQDEFVVDSVTVSQRLTMLNGKFLAESTESNPVLNASAHIRMFTGDDARAVDLAYLCVLNRYPHPAERKHFETRLVEANGRDEAMEDLFWVLMNSSEFAWNH